VQYASGDYVRTLSKHHLIPSMSRPANPYDNASCESFIKTLKREEIDANQYQDLDHLRANIGEFIERYYNRCRLHSALAYQSPEEFEQAAQANAVSMAATMSFFRHREIIDPIGSVRRVGSRPKSASRPIVSMSLRLVIPWRLLSSRAHLRFASRW